MTPDQPAASDFAHDLVSDSSAQERFFRTIDMTGVAFDGHARNIGMIGTGI